ncbi:Hypothetical_protein [Hexamita inflata]|uniref:Hypothetical_protein n=1 Tax=Hexamita inflata TaxID=28002 RepID=A0AA86P810_9EUKA|nr:Hypothetical protein HINF_LOCUS21364 [Hexamita inflata]CAI9933720.1 Hypothetical protein HINF_LOCUS21365 [Hexamita inflata]
MTHLAVNLSTISRRMLIIHLHLKHGLKIEPLQIGRSSKSNNTVTCSNLQIQRDNLSQIDSTNYQQIATWNSENSTLLTKMSYLLKKQLNIGAAIIRRKDTKGNVQ